MQKKCMYCEAKDEGQNAGCACGAYMCDGCAAKYGRICPLCVMEARIILANQWRTMCCTEKMVVIPRERVTDKVISREPITDESYASVARVMQELYELSPAC